MRRIIQFKPKIFAAMMLVGGAAAGLMSWITGLNFWVLAGILIVAVLVNGLIASVEDGDKPDEGID